MQKVYPWEFCYYLLFLALPDVEEEKGPCRQNDPVGLWVRGSRGHNPAIFIPSVSEILNFDNDPI